MSNTQLKSYIDQKLEKLDREKDMNDVLMKGKLSFGMEADYYRHLPAWKSLLEKKRKMTRSFWISALLLALTVSGITGGIWNRMEQNWLRAFAGWLVLSLFIMLFYVLSYFFGIFIHFRKTEREIRKLIYQDLLFQIDRQEQEKS